MGYNLHNFGYAHSELGFHDTQRNKPQECNIGVFIFRLIMSTFLARKWGDETNKQKLNVARGEIYFPIESWKFYRYEGHVRGSSIRLRTRHTVFGSIRCIEMFTSKNAIKTKWQHAVQLFNRTKSIMG